MAESEQTLISVPSQASSETDRATSTVTEDGSDTGKPRERTGSTEVHPLLILSAQCDDLTLPPRVISLRPWDELSVGRGRRTEVQAGERRSAALTVTDTWMSRTHARLTRTRSDYWLHDCGARNGTLLDGQRLTVPQRLVDGAVVELGKTFFVYRCQQEPSGSFGTEAAASSLSTCNPVLQEQIAVLRRVARAGLSIALLGESGTGKEVAARWVHEATERKGAFVALNCGAISPELFESELFGHRKGAFSGAATARKGLILSAEGGTLFLDEVADLPANCQVKLLRTLQEREVLAVGAVRPVPVNLQVVSATCKNLPALVEQGLFRADLFSRLQGHRFRLPALRERKEDLGLLLQKLLHNEEGSLPSNIQLSRRALRALFAYRWPLNIRELGDALKVAVALSDEQPVPLEAFPQAIRHALGRRQESKRPAVPPAEGGISCAQLVEQLQRHHGNLSAIERELRKSRPTLRKWCKRHNLNPNDFRRDAL